MSDRSSNQRARHLLRRAWLNVFYFPFWRSVNAARRARKAAFDSGFNIVSTEELLNVTEGLDEHPEGWEHPCACALCRSYGE